MPVSFTEFLTGICDVGNLPLGIEMICFFGIISNSSHLKKSLIAFGIFRIPTSLALQFLYPRGGFRNSNQGTAFGEFANSLDMNSLNSVKETDPCVFPSG